MKFAEISIGTFFRFDYEGLPSHLAHAEALGPFRKVAEDGAVHIADWRGVKWYVPSAAKVVQMHLRPDSLAARDH